MWPASLGAVGAAAGAVPPGCRVKLLVAGAPFVDLPARRPAGQHLQANGDAAIGPGGQRQGAGALWPGTPPQAADAEAVVEPAIGLEPPKAGVALALRADQVAGQPDAAIGHRQHVDHREALARGGGGAAAADGPTCVEQPAGLQPLHDRAARVAPQRGSGHPDAATGLYPQCRHVDVLAAEIQRLTPAAAKGRVEPAAGRIALEVQRIVVVVDAPARAVVATHAQGAGHGAADGQRQQQQRNVEPRHHFWISPRQRYFTST
jgi:hypothetical protein